MSAAAVAHPGEPIRSWLLAVLAAALVGRTLLTSGVSADSGDDLPFDVLLLAIAGGYFLWVAAQGSLARRVGLVDLAVLVLVGVSIASGLFAVSSTTNGALSTFGVRECEPRPVMNMLWAWIAAGLIYLLARQLVRTPREARSWLAILCASAVALSSGMVYHSLAVIDAGPQDPASPIAAPWTGAVLAPLLVAATGIVCQQTSTATAPRLAAWLLCLAVVAGGLGAADNRPSVAAAAAGLALVPACCGHRGWRATVYGFLMAGSLLAAVFAAGVWRQNAPAAHGNSPAARTQLWQATLGMIAAYPLAGVAPGAFHEYYTQFQSPGASGHARSPHNMFLEVWATAGTLALTALLGSLAAAGWYAWRAAATAAPEPSDHHDDEPNLTGLLALGGVAGVAVAFVVAGAFGLALTPLQVGLALVSGGLVWMLARPWIHSGPPPGWLPLLALAVSALCLTFSEGMSLPAVSWTFFSLLALAVNQAEDHGRAAVTAPTPSARLASGALAVVALAGLIACYRSGLLSVLECQAALASAAEPGRNPEDRLALASAAAAADPLSGEPWVRIAALELDRYTSRGSTAADRDRFIQALQPVLFLRRHSAQTWVQAGRWYRQLHAHSKLPQDAEETVLKFRGAVVLAPQDAVARAELAVAQAVTGPTGAAERNARRALQLDAAAPVAERLPEALRRQVIALLLSPS